MKEDAMGADGPLWIEVVTDTYVPDVNGVAFSLGRLCEGLRALGHRVEVVRSGKACGPHETAVLSWPLPGYWEIKVGAPWPGQLRRRWQARRPDVVYVAIETPLGFSAAAAARKLGIPVIGGFHTNFRDYLRNYGCEGIGSRVWAYQKWFHGRLAGTLVPSPAARDRLVDAGFGNVTVLGRGVDTALFHPDRRSEALRRRFGAGPDTPIALIVGRVSGEKNIGLAIRAFERMRLSRPDLVGVVVGDGPVRAKLEREHPQVRFTGYLLGEELAECYASADLLLFPSETETFGNVLLEGMASGLAAVSYDLAAAAWHGRDGVNLLRVAPGDDEAFVAAAMRLLDPRLREILAAGARKTALELGWPQIVRDLESILRQARP